MREHVERQPVAGTVAERADALEWAADQVIEMAELRERFEIRGRLLLKIRSIVNTFKNAELAMKSIKQRLDGLDMSEDER